MARLSEGEGGTENTSSNVQDKIQNGMASQKQKVLPLLRDTYFAMIKNSVGTKLFRNFYAQIDGRKIDVMKNGGLSCAFFLSSLLSTLGLAKATHTTVESTVKDMEQSGWKPTKKLMPGSIIVWEEKKEHKHIGFYIGNNRALSNSSKKKSPATHHLTYGIKNGKPVRKIEAIYQHKKLT
ncbi:MAG: NlpC/P60 family protein [Patescibacteria group bacterium]